MNRRNGKQVYKVLGVDVELVNGTLVTKKDAQRIVERSLGFTRGADILSPARGARAAVESYRKEGWPLGDAGARLRFDAPLCHVSSLEARILDHLERRAEASRQNGLKGGRPRTTGTKSKVEGDGI